MTVIGAATRLVNWPRTQNQGGNVVDELEDRMIPALNIDPRNVSLPANYPTGDRRCQHRPLPDVPVRLRIHPPLLLELRQAAHPLKGRNASMSLRLLFALVAIGCGLYLLVKSAGDSLPIATGVGLVSAGIGLVVP